MESIKELRKICQNPAEYYNPQSFFDNKIWRSFSIYITKLLLYTPVKPDHITFFMIFWGFLVGYLFSIGVYRYMLLGAITLEFLYALDAVDGEIARYKKMMSLNGVFLDLVAHSTNVAVPFLGLTIGLYKINPSVYIVLAGLSASVFSIFCLNIQSMKHHVMFRELIKQAKKTGITKSKKVYNKSWVEESVTKGSILKSAGKWVNYLHDSIYMNQIIFLAAIFNKLHWVLIFYGLTFPIMWLTKLVYEYKIGYKPYEYLLNPYQK